MYRTTKGGPLLLLVAVLLGAHVSYAATEATVVGVTDAVTLRVRTAGGTAEVEVAGIKILPTQDRQSTSFARGLLLGARVYLHPIEGSTKTDEGGIVRRIVTLSGGKEYATLLVDRGFGEPTQEKADMSSGRDLPVEAVAETARQPEPEPDSEPMTAPKAPMAPPPSTKETVAESPPGDPLVTSENLDVASTPPEPKTSSESPEPSLPVESAVAPEPPKSKTPKLAPAEPAVEQPAPPEPPKVTEIPSASNDKKEPAGTYFFTISGDQRYHRGDCAVVKGRDPVRTDKLTAWKEYKRCWRCEPPPPPANFSGERDPRLCGYSDEHGQSCMRRKERKSDYCWKHKDPRNRKNRTETAETDEGSK